MSSQAWSCHRYLTSKEKLIGGLSTGFLDATRTVSLGDSLQLSGILRVQWIVGFIPHHSLVTWRVF